MTVAVFDEWYETIATSPGWDRFVRQALDLPPTVESTGYLNGPGLVEVQQRLHLQPGGTLVELGCGRAGYGLAAITSTHAHLVGVDFSASALRAAHSAAARLELDKRARFVHADLTDTGLPGESADAILCVDAFHFAASVTAAAQEVARLVKPGGQLVITTWEPLNPAAAQRLPERIRRMDIKRDLTEAGLVDVQVLDRPEWSRIETAFWTEASRLDPGSDAAVAALREEGLEFLPLAAALRRRLVVARRW